MHQPALSDNEVANFLKIAEPTFYSEISPKTFDSEGNLSDFIAYDVVLFMKEVVGHCKSNETMD
jgi:predicted DNA-binding transcriptional regulator AlpA